MPGSAGTFGGNPSQSILQPPGIRARAAALAQAPLDYARCSVTALESTSVVRSRDHEGAVGSLFGNLLNVATLLFAPQPIAYARGSVRRRFGAANVRERMRNYL